MHQLHPRLTRPIPRLISLQDRSWKLTRPGLPRPQLQSVFTILRFTNGHGKESSDGCPECIGESYGLLDDAEHGAFDISDGLGVHGRQLVDQPVVQRQEREVEVKTLPDGLLSPGRGDFCRGERRVPSDRGGGKPGGSLLFLHRRMTWPSPVSLSAPKSRDGGLGWTRSCM